jgi:tetratricopeptide (TPR) repeat protein
MAPVISIFGHGHEETLTPRLVLALTYRENGRPSDAIPLLEQVVADRERIAGLDPLDTVEARLNLALSYLEAGHADEATAIFERIAPEAERLLYRYQLSRLDPLEMAAPYAPAGRTDKAIAAAQWGADDREHRPGPDDRLTVAACALLVDLYQAGRIGEATAVQEQAGDTET